jgi:type I restriction enzyme, S subunit
MQNVRYRRIKLKDVCDRITVGHVGPMAGSYVPEGIPFLRSQNIGPFHLQLDDLKFIPTDFHRKLNKSALRPGDVAVVRTGYPGTACVIPDKFEELNCSDLVIITPGKNLNPHYLAAIFNSAWGIASVAGNLVGAAQQHFNVGAAKDLEVSLPPRPEQDRIANIFSAYDDLIENNLRRIKILEEMACAVYREWFLEFRFPGHEKNLRIPSTTGSIPKEWQITTFGELYNTGSGGTPSRTRPEYFEDGTIDWVKSQELLDGFILSTKEHITQTALEESSAKLFPADSVLIALYGATIGKLGILSKEAATNQACCAVLSKHPSFGREFAFLTLLLNRERIIGLRLGAAQQNISQVLLRNLACVKPPENLVARFSNLVTPFFDRIHILQRQIQNLRRMRDLLLPKLISGGSVRE